MLFDAMNTEMVKSLMEALPMEVTVIDVNDEVAGWNKHETRLFKRPMSSIGLNFRQCHPEKSLSMVERIISEMKAGTRDKVRFWMDMEVKAGEPKHKILVEFYALRDDKGDYIGCMECTQDIEDLRKIEGQKRLMD